MVLEQGLERFEDLDLAGDPRGGLSLPLDHGHPQRALVSGHQALQVLQQQLRRNAEGVKNHVKTVVTAAKVETQSYKTPETMRHHCCLRMIPVISVETK